MSRQSLFNAGFAPQAMTRQAAAAANNNGRIFNGQQNGARLPGVRSPSGPQPPISAASSVNLARQARDINPFYNLVDEFDAAAGQVNAQSRLTRAQRLALQQADNSQAQFPVGSPQLRDNWNEYVGRQTGAGAMDVAPRTPAGSRAGSLRQQQASNVAGLLGTPADLLGQQQQGAGFFGQQQGAGQVDMDLAAFGQPQQQQQQPAFGGQDIQTRLDQLRQQQAQLLGGAATAPPALGGAAQGLGSTAPFAARYRHNSFDGSAGQAYAGAYGRGGLNNAAGQAYAGQAYAGGYGRRKSVGFGQDSNPFASQSFAGNYNGSSNNNNNGYARPYAGAYGNRGNGYGAMGGNNNNNNYAGRYGGQGNGYGAMNNNSNYAAQYAGQYGGAQNPRGRRASFGVGNGNGYY
ncbi:hypothetical protein psal_cds_238 [Pandoravirus salinus]|uniref:Uncharacterized protein n=1 Tax=Pandoravirus salinus TaxID=1349410 RepID=S4VTW9_9VIRU|nr:hypothetical protein psal_cds_238 [Pandoravirus salinus]AGO83783.1 hypothetical protein psal_cds_238 [Pandoravirus salinus]